MKRIFKFKEDTSNEKREEATTPEVALIKNLIEEKDKSSTTLICLYINFSLTRKENRIDDYEIKVYDKNKWQSFPLTEGEYTELKNWLDDKEYCYTLFANAYGKNVQIGD